MFWSIQGWALWLLISKQAQKHRYLARDQVLSMPSACGCIFIFISKLIQKPWFDVMKSLHSEEFYKPTALHHTSFFYITNYSRTKCDYVFCVNILEALRNIYTNN